VKLLIEPKQNNLNEAQIHINGAKNALLPLLFSTPLVDGKTSFTNVPLQLKDYQGSKKILTRLGLTFEEGQDRVQILNNGLVQEADLPSSLTKATRCSLYLLGSAAKKNGHIAIGLPGGCSFGRERRFDLHLDGLRALNAEVRVENGLISIRHLRDIDVQHTLAFPSVGATTNLILYATLGHKEVILSNCAVEPEIINLINFLNQCGAKIAVDTIHREVVVQGVTSLHASEMKLIPDRIQIMTYVVLAMMHKKRLHLKGVTSLGNLQTPLQSLVELGLTYDYQPKEGILIIHGDQLTSFKGLEMVCQPYPGFPTDLQPIFAMLGLVANSAGTIKDNVIPERTAYLDEIMKLGAEVMYKDRGILTQPINETLKGAAMCCTDLRGGMACVMAASVANGPSIISNADQVFRGYDNLLDNLSHFMHVTHLEKEQMVTALNVQNQVA
jgi:UDP-N-acetylglucosamine 1-carboxyvinyltransferase